MTQVPVLRAALQDAADRRYGYARVRRPLLVLVPALAAVLLAFVVSRPSPDTERVATGPVHAVSTTTLPAPKQTLRVPTPQLLSPQAAASAYAAARGKGSVFGTLVSAWTVPGIEHPVFLTRESHEYCIILWFARDPGYAMGCPSKQFSATLHEGGTVVSWIPPGLRAPALKDPSGRTHPLALGAGRLIALTGVTYPSTLGESSQALGVEPIKRFQCSDGTHQDVRVGDIWNEDVMGPFDPCAQR